MWKSSNKSRIIKKVNHMPKFDGTGSLGKGPFTGRGEGYCVLPEDWSQVAKEVNSIRERKPIRPMTNYLGLRALIPTYPMMGGFGRGCRRRNRWF